MPILYNKKNNKNSPTQPTQPAPATTEANQEMGFGFNQSDKARDIGVSRQSGKTVFVGEGLDAPVNETPKQQQILQYKNIRTGNQPSIEDLKGNIMYHPGRKNPVDVSNYTEADYIRDATMRLQNVSGDNWKYSRIGDKLVQQRGDPTNYTKNMYSTGQFYVTDAEGNVVGEPNYPRGMDYQKSLILSNPNIIK